MRKQALYDKVSGAKETVKQSADESVSADPREETSSSEAKDKSMMGKFRNFKVSSCRSPVFPEPYSSHVTERVVRQDPSRT